MHRTHSLRKADPPAALPESMRRDDAVIHAPPLPQPPLRALPADGVLEPLEPARRATDPASRRSGPDGRSRRPRRANAVRTGARR